jgi:hypothetical protein
MGSDLDGHPVSPSPRMRSGGYLAFHLMAGGQFLKTGPLTVGFRACSPHLPKKGPPQNR